MLGANPKFVIFSSIVIVLLNMGVTAQRNYFPVKPDQEQNISKQYHQVNDQRLWENSSIIVNPTTFSSSVSLKTNEGGAILDNYKNQNKIVERNYFPMKLPAGGKEDRKQNVVTQSSGNEPDQA